MSSLDSALHRSFGLRGCLIGRCWTLASTSHAQPTSQCPQPTPAAISRSLDQVPRVSGTTRQPCRGSFTKAPLTAGDPCRIRASSFRSTHRVGSMPIRTPMPTAVTSSAASREGVAGSEPATATTPFATAAAGSRANRQGRPLSSFAASMAASAGASMFGASCSLSQMYSISSAFGINSAV